MNREEKIIKVINSCTTLKHIDSCFRWFNKIKVSDAIYNILRKKEVSIRNNRGKRRTRNIYKREIKEMFDSFLHEFSLKYNLQKEFILLKCRKPDVVAARYLFYTELTETHGHNPLYYAKISGFDHTTVLHALKITPIRIEKKDKYFMKYINNSQIKQ